MEISPNKAGDALMLVAPEHSREDLAPLLEAYAQRDIAVDAHWYVASAPTIGQVANRLDGHHAVLMVGPGRRAPRTVVDGPVLMSGSGRAVPVGWLPDTGGGLRLFAGAAARLHLREQGAASIALLSQRQPRYLRLAGRMAELLCDRPVFRWTAEALVPESMIRGLGSGLGAAVYFGHGRPTGWAGYYGVRAHSFDDFHGEPLGAVLSLCCRTASRYHTGLSFAEALPLRGVCGATLAAVTDTLHTDNTRWAVRIGDALATGVRNIGELVTAALPPGDRRVAAYRILGDPLAPLLAPRSGLERAARIEVFP